MIIDAWILLLIALGSWLITAVIIYKSRSGWLLDIPNHRSAHNQPTARGGGLAIVIVFYWALMVGTNVDVISDNYKLVIGSGLLIAGVGFWDDHRHIPARWRLLVQFIAACWAVYWLGYQGVEFVVACIVLIWCLNLFNFMDGIDGIAATEALFFNLAVAVFYSVTDVQIAGVAMLLMAAVLGFLLWNLPPAKIFMGDVGSGFLGFLIGVIILSQGLFSPEFFVGLILFSVFISDATLTLLIRMVRGERWYQAHSCHAFQHQARRVGHFQTTAVVLLINLFWLLPMAVLTLQLPEWALAFTVLTYLPLLLLAWRLGAGFD